MPSSTSYHHISLQKANGGKLHREEKNKTSHPGTSGVVTLSHVWDSFSVPTKIIFERDAEFVGLVFNLGEEVHYAWNGGEPSGVFHQHYFNLVYLPRKACLKLEFKPQDYSFYTIAISPAFLKQCTEPFPVMHQFLANVRRNIPCMASVKPLKSRSEVVRLFGRLLDESSEPLHGTAINALLEQIIMFSLHELRSIDQPVKLYEAWRVQECLRKDLSRHWTRDMLAREVGMEETSMNRAFKKTYGVTVFKFLYEERMKKAMSLVKETDFPIKRIARVVGYRSETHFFGAFKKKFNTVPGIHRNREKSP
jgi:AraC-like DNA-binding protein